MQSTQLTGSPPIAEITCPNCKYEFHYERRKGNHKLTCPECKHSIILKVEGETQRRSMRSTQVPNEKKDEVKTESVERNKNTDHIAQHTWADQIVYNYYEKTYRFSWYLIGIIMIIAGIALGPCGVVIMLQIEGVELWQKLYFMITAISPSIIFIMGGGIFFMLCHLSKKIDELS